MTRDEVKDEIEFALEQAEMGLGYRPPCKVMAELCRTWLAVDAAPVPGEYVEIMDVYGWKLEVRGEDIVAVHNAGTANEAVLWVGRTTSE